MIRITIRELHMHTGKWVRNAADRNRIVVTERGRPVAALGPYAPEEVGIPFSRRRESAEFAGLPAVGQDSTALISDDRERS